MTASRREATSTAIQFHLTTVFLFLFFIPPRCDDFSHSVILYRRKQNGVKERCGCVRDGKNLARWEFVDLAALAHSPWNSIKCFFVLYHFFLRTPQGSHAGSPWDSRVFLHTIPDGNMKRHVSTLLLRFIKPNRKYKKIPAKCSSRGDVIE